MITKKQIQTIQELKTKHKARRKTGLFVVEGERIVSEMPKDKIRALYVTEEYADTHSEAENAETVEERVFEKLSDTKTPQGILAVMSCPSFSKEEVFAKENGLFMILESIQDPGNLGTIFRTAEGAGVDAVFLVKGTTDIYAPKAVRSTMGSIYRMPHFFVETVEEAADILHMHGICLFAAEPDAKKRYDEADYRKPAAFLIGNEGNGLTEEAKALSDETVHIPMGGKLESLNAAVAASLLMYEAARQRGF